MTHGDQPYVMSLCNFSEKLVMIIGGATETYPPWTNDIELVSLDASPVPGCLSDLNPFPIYEAIVGAAGALASGMVC